MNRIIAGLIGGIAGALTTTLLHEIIRHSYANAPRLDLLGEEAAVKTIRATGAKPPQGRELFELTMIADIVSNASYYSAAAFHKKSPTTAGAALGLFAGISAVALPPFLNLKTEPTAANSTRKMITVGLYTIGGIVAGTVIRKLDRKPR